jgi:antirestriction protein
MEQTPQPPPSDGQEPQPEQEPRPKPRIYVACLSDYNAGRLHGVWIDAAQEPGALEEEVERMLDISPSSGAEEYAIHDWEGFGPLLLFRNEDLVSVSVIARGIVKYGIAFAHYAMLVGPWAVEAPEHFEERYEGHFESLTAYAEQLLEDLCYLDELDRLQAQLPVGLRPYVQIDVEAFARDLDYSGDIATSEDNDGGIYVFRTR